MAKEAFRELPQIVDDDDAEGIKMPLYAIPLPEICSGTLASLRENFHQTFDDYYKESRNIPPTRVSIYEDMSSYLNTVFHSEGDVREAWERLAGKIVAGDGEYAVWEEGRLLVKTQSLADEIGISVTFSPITMDWGKLDGGALRRKEWPVALVGRNGETFYQVLDPNLLYYLATSNLLKNERQSLAVRGPVLSFMAEILLVNQSSHFEPFIRGLVQTIGVDEGMPMVAVILDDLEQLYFSQDQSPLDDKKALLASTWKALRREYTHLIYKNRPQIVDFRAAEKLLAVASDISAFLGTIVTAAGIENKMRSMFGTKGNEIYAVALAENPAISGTMLLLADIQGYDPERTRSVTASALFCWGIVNALDHVIDGQMMMGNGESLLAKYGIANALGITFGGFLGFSEKIFEDRILTEAFLEMLTLTCEADQQTRQLAWDSHPEAFIPVMKQLNVALSWFGEYLGQRTGWKEAGSKLREFQENLLCLVQLNGDIRDTMTLSEKGKEKAVDYGIKWTLPLSTLLKLPEDLHPDLKNDQEFIKSFWQAEYERKRLSREPPSPEVQEKIEKALRIGRKYRQAVVAALYQSMSEIYRQADRALGEVKSSIIMDERNEKCLVALKASLEAVWGQFCEYGRDKYGEE